MSDAEAEKTSSSDEDEEDEEDEDEDKSTKKPLIIKTPSDKARIATYPLDDDDETVIMAIESEIQRTLAGILVNPGKKRIGFGNVGFEPDRINPNGNTAPPNPIDNSHESRLHAGVMMENDVLIGHHMANIISKKAPSPAAPPEPNPAATPDSETGPVFPEDATRIAYKPPSNANNLQDEELAASLHG